MSFLSNLSGAIKACGEGALAGASISTLTVALASAVVAPPVGVAIGLVLAGTVFGCALFTLKSSPVGYQSADGSGFAEMDQEFTQNILTDIATLSTALSDINSEEFLKGMQYDITYGVASILDQSGYGYQNAVLNVVNTYYSLVMHKVTNGLTNIYQFLKDEAFTAYSVLQYLNEETSSVTFQYDSGAQSTVPVSPIALGVHYVNIPSPASGTNQTIQLPVSFVLQFPNSYFEFYIFSPKAVMSLFPTSSYNHYVQLYTVSNGVMQIGNTVNYTTLTEDATMVITLSPNAPQFVGGILGTALASQIANSIGTTAETINGVNQFAGYSLAVNVTVLNATGNLMVSYFNCPQCTVQPNIDPVLDALYAIINDYQALLDYAEEVYDYYVSQGYTSQQALDTLGVLNASILTKVCSQSIGSTLSTASLLTQLQGKLNPETSVLVSDYGIQVTDLTVNIAGSISHFNNVIVELTDPEALISPSGYKVKYGGIIYDPYSQLVVPIPAGSTISSSKNTYVWRQDVYSVDKKCYHAPVPPSITGLSNNAYIDVDGVTVFQAGQSVSVTVTQVNDDSSLISKGQVTMTPLQTFTYIPYDQAYFTYTPEGTPPAYIKTANPDYLLLAVVLVLLAVAIGVGAYTAGKEKSQVEGTVAQYAPYLIPE